MKKIKIHLLLLLALLMIANFLTCDNRPILSEMAHNSLQIVLKGTYESNNPRDWDMPGVNNILVQDDSVNDAPSPAEDVFPTRLMLDIAEMKLGNKKFANYRQTYSINVDNSDPFFNGAGITLENDDPPNDTFNSIKLYIRKIGFDNAKRYELNGATYVNDTPDPTFLFHEETESGYNFNERILNSYYDKFRIEESNILRTYPLRIPIVGGLKYDKDETSMVLEIRLVLKNFIKKYEYDFYGQNDAKQEVRNVLHYYAPSDWLQDVKADEEDVGGNLVAVARVYVPGKTGRITGTCPIDRYVIAIPVVEDIADYQIASTTRSTNPCNYPLPPSPYVFGESISLKLDYYLKMDKYFYDWNEVFKVGTCNDNTKLATGMDNYANAINKFKIPPFSVWTGTSGSYVIENMSPGQYKVFISTTSPAYGEMFNLVFEDIDPLVPGTTPTNINSGDTITVNF